MAAGEGIITRKEIITDEALAFGTVYRKNVDQAIDANKILIDQFKVLFKVSGDYRKAQDNFDFRKAKQEESVSHQKILNQIKQMTAAEIELEKVKRAKLRTEQEILKVAKEQTDLAKQRARAEGVIEKEIQKIKQERAKTEKELQKISQERVKTEKELSRLKIENERLAKIQAKTEITNTRELERIKKMLFDLENKVIKLQQDKIRLDQKQVVETKKKVTLTMEERVQQQLANKADKVHSSIDKYRQSRRNQFKNDLVKDHIKMQNYLNKQNVFDGSALEKKLDDLISVTKRKNMSVNVNIPKSDSSHEMWRLKQLGYFK